MGLKNKGLPKKYFFYLLNVLFLSSIVLFISSRCFSNIQITQNYPDSLNIKRTFILPDQIMETSGLYYADSLVWTFNDSGGEPEIYAFSMGKNKIVRQIKLPGAYNLDWEAITSDNKSLYIGDIGNNFGTRDTLCIYKVDKKSIAQNNDTLAESSKILFTYPGYKPVSLFTFTRSSFDCEAMVCWNDSIYLFTKDWVANTSTIYRIPNNTGYYVAKKVFTFNSDGLITDACYNRNYLLLLGYKNFQPFLLISPSPEKNILDTTHLERMELTSLQNAQTEGIAFYNDSTILISAEKTNLDATLWVMKQKK